MSEKTGKIYGDIKVKIGMLLTFAVVTFIIVCIHEPWRDEAQSWLIARDLSIIDIIKQMKYEGHPYLWHLLLVPFAKLGFPYFFARVTSWLITNMAAAILIFKAPFSYGMKLLFLCTSPFLYLYSAFARNYCLILLAVVLLAVFYRDRHKKPIRYMLAMVLLVGSHAIMYGMVAVLVLMFYIEEFIEYKKHKKVKKNTLISFAILVVGSAMLLFPMFQSLMLNKQISYSISDGSTSIVDKLVETIVRWLQNYTSTGNDDITLFLVAGIAILLLYYQVRNHWKNSLIVIFTVLFQEILYMFVVSQIIHRTMTIIPIMLFVLWIQDKDDIRNKSGRWLMIVFLLLNIVSSFKLVKYDFVDNYSDSKITAEFISNEIPSDSTFISTNIERTSSLIPYLNKYKFIDPKKCKEFTFAEWDDVYAMQLTKEMLEDCANKYSKKGEKLYLVDSYTWNNENIAQLVEDGIIKLIYSSLEVEDKNAPYCCSVEKYRIFQVNVN